MAREERDEEDNEGMEADYEGVLQTHVRYYGNSHMTYDIHVHMCSWIQRVVGLAQDRKIL